MSIPRAATGAELAKFRSDNQWAKWRVMIDEPAVVLACRVNQTFTTHDMVHETLFNNVTFGATANVRAGMTVLLGTTPGGHQAGITYARKAPTADMLYTGEGSGVDWENLLYITVLDDFSLWPENLRMLTNGTVYMRYDVAYSDQHLNFDPVVMAGPHRVLKLTDADVSTTFNLASSFVFGSTISAYACVSLTAGATISNGNTATPTAVLPAAGRYVLAFTLTAANGKSSTTYRNVYVWDDNNPPPNVAIGPASSDENRGGWDFWLECNEAAAYRDRTLVILFDEAYYNGVAGSVGSYSGAENIVTQGWIEDEQPVSDENGGSVRFTVRGPHFWFGKMYNFVPIGYDWVSGTPATWLQLPSSTVTGALDQIVFTYLKWRTTALNCIDWVPSGDLAQGTALEAPAGSAWQQLRALTFATLRIMPGCDCYGRLVTETDACLVPAADRAGIPTVVSLTKDDYESIAITRRTVTPVSQVILNGIAASGGAGAAYFSFAPGHIPLTYGEPLPIQNMMLVSQAQANELAGSILEKENCPLSFEIRNVTGYNKLVDIRPRQYIELDIAAGDTPRGIAYAGLAVVRQVTLENDAKTGEMTVNWYADAKTEANLFCNGDIPADDPADPPIVYPPFPPLPPPPSVPPVPPPSIITPVPAKGYISILFSGLGLWFLDLNKTYFWQSANAPFVPGIMASFTKFDVNRFGRAFLMSPTEVWSTVLGSNIGTIIGSGPIFLAPPWNLTESGETTRYYISAIACNPLVDQMAAVMCQQYQFPGWPRVATLGYITNSGGVLTRCAQVDDNSFSGYAANSLTFYKGKWYYHWKGTNDNIYMNEKGINFPSQTDWFQLTGNAVSGNYFSRGALDASLLYTRDSKISIPDHTVTALGEPTDVKRTQNGFDCDPTGQYLMSVRDNAGTGYSRIYTSSDYGATWASLSTIPSAYMTLGQTFVVNAGDSLKWVIVYGNYIADPPPHSEISVQYTADGGLTWTSLTANLHDVVPETTPALAMRYS